MQPVWFLHKDPKNNFSKFGKRYFDGWATSKEHRGIAAGGGMV